MKKILLLAVLVGFFAACQRNNKKKEKNQHIESADTLSYKYDSIKVYSKIGVVSEPEFKDTAKAIITYPVFNNAGIDSFIQKQVFNFFGQEENYTSYQDIAQSFVGGYDDFAKENKDYKNVWFLEIHLEILKQRPDYISLLYTHADYTGGAHPNTVFTYINFNPKNRKEITLDSLFIPGYKEKLRTIAEKIFRKNEGLSPNESLSGQYFFENETFSLPENFTINEQGLNFLYNPYEIKAYAAGTTKLVIPFNELKEITKPHSILISFSNQ